MRLSDSLGRFTTPQSCATPALILMPAVLTPSLLSSWVAPPGFRDGFQFANHGLFNPPPSCRHHPTYHLLPLSLSGSVTWFLNACHTSNNQPRDPVADDRDREHADVCWHAYKFTNGLQDLWGIDSPDYPLQKDRPKCRSTLACPSFFVRGVVVFFLDGLKGL
jgi:hypothetical protein